MSTNASREEVGGKERNTESCLGIVRVKVGHVSEVDGRRVVDSLEGTAGVEVAHSLDLFRLLLGSRTLACVNGSRECTRVGKVVSRDTAHELYNNQLTCSRPSMCFMSYILLGAREVELASLALGSQPGNIARQV